MLNRKIVPLGCTLLVVAMLPVAIARAYEISWYTIDGGGGVSTDGSFELQGTISQPDAGTGSGGGYQLNGGFWFEQPVGDCNATGSVNLLDYADLEACLLGPDAGLGAGCDCFDFDNDGDNDLLDFAEFQMHFVGS